MTILFYLAGAVAVLATLLAVTRRNAVHALLYLIVSLLAVALVFFTLGAPFVAALEVIIYAGAIIVLFLFVVMMLNLGKDAEATERGWQPRRAWIGPALLAGFLFALLLIRHRHRKRLRSPARRRSARRRWARCCSVPT